MSKRKSNLLKKLQEKEIVLSEERTVLSKERTILSFMQTGLTSIGLGIVLTYYLKETLLTYLGYVLILTGFIEVLQSIRKLKTKQKEVEMLKRRGAI
ncbi:hypothetical protein A3K64_03765 [Candidatus Micrarchaeota archaeon RBG_16_36_9]|nr:MAG: hypothetical protein A3K64_03765 [Candidatus Micrarchaeota archaeon RBG_16_36_9]